ncbi:MAG: hypothetical protein WBR10_11325 [Candidatus Acidiferrum sp.]
MEPPLPTQSQGFDNVPDRTLRGSLREAVRFWEPRRIVYNLVLGAVVVIWVAATWPHFRPAITLASLLFLVVFALLANACYCAAYLVEIPMQLSSLSTVLRRLRWGVWLTGTIFAIVLANYWIADEIYPYVR